MQSFSEVPGVRASTYEFQGKTVQSIASSMEGICSSWKSRAYCDLLINSGSWTFRTRRNLKHYLISHCIDTKYKAVKFMNCRSYFVTSLFLPLAFWILTLFFTVQLSYSEFPWFLFQTNSHSLLLCAVSPSMSSFILTEFEYIYVYFCVFHQLKDFG